MVKKSGSRSSRSERNAGRKRAERARQHGLPARPEPAPRTRAVTPEPSDDSYGEARSSDAPLSHAKKSAGIPTLVKVVGGALVILIGVYFLSRQRDDALLETKPAPEPAAAVSASQSPAADVAPELVPAPEASAPAEPSPEPAPASTAAAPVVSVTPPVKPVVLAPVVAEPSKPKVEKPTAAAPTAPKAIAAPVAPAPAAPPPVVAPAAPAPKPVAPKVAPAPAAPVDNPY